MTLSNNEITLRIEDHGAELSSIRCNGREYLWGGDARYWKRHSPVLFPIVGSVWQGEYRLADGRTFRMGQHGLARDLDFTCLGTTGHTAEYVLRSSEETLEKYPFPFLLRISYTLEGRKVVVGWHVENTGTEAMPFQIGAHPAFYWPMLSDETIDAGVEAMEGVLRSSSDRGSFLFPERPDRLVRTMLGEGGCADVSLKEEVALQDGRLPLDTHSFDRDALVLENGQVHAVSLCGADGKPYLTLRWDAPLVGLWSSPGKNAPFVCIEPWYGRADRTHYAGTFEEKDWMQWLAPGETFDARYTIEIE